MKYTRMGFSIRAIGANNPASRLSGVQNGTGNGPDLPAGRCHSRTGRGADRPGTGSFPLADFSANLGFLGIGVALVARLHPCG